MIKISPKSSLRDLLTILEKNHLGAAVVCLSNGEVVGVISDGDVRRALLAGATLDEPVEMHFNSNFIHASVSTPREVLLKQLDQKGRLIPILDQEKRLVDFVTRDRLPQTKESEIYVRAKSPVRVSFGGGGSDLTYFFANEKGAVINSTVALFSHATLKKRQDQKVYVVSSDLEASLEAENLGDLPNSVGPFGLILATLKTVNPNFGFELYLRSDYPMKSGLGGSAAVVASILGCFNQYRQDKWNRYEMAELAYQAERICFGIDGGWQDQYATIFGGFNLQEFNMDQNLIHPLRISQDVILELQESLLLCDTGISHDSGDIHQNQRVEMTNSDLRKGVQASVELTYKIRDYLLKGQLEDFGTALNEGWQLKRQFTSKISNDKIDKLYDGALNNGACGGKLLGAGGGGVFLFFAKPFKRHDLANFLSDAGLKTFPFTFDVDGLASWSVRSNVH